MIFLSNLLFAIRILIFVSSVRFFLQRKANSTIEHQKCKGQEKRDRFLFSKVIFNYHISQRKKTLVMIQFSQIGIVISIRIIVCS